MVGNLTEILPGWQSWGLEGQLHQIFSRGGPAHDEKMDPTGSEVL